MRQPLSEDEADKLCRSLAEQQRPLCGDHPLLTFVVLGEPQGRVHMRAVPITDRQGRVRAQAIPERGTPAQRAWPSLVREAASAAMHKDGFAKHDGGAYLVSAIFVMPRPQAYYWSKPHAEPRCWRGKDLNNMMKALEDAMKGVVWRDDAQVAGYGWSYKRYAKPGEACRAEVMVQYLGDWRD